MIACWENSRSSFALCTMNSIPNVSLQSQTEDQQDPYSRICEFEPSFFNQLVGPAFWLGAQSGTVSELKEQGSRCQCLRLEPFSSPPSSWGLPTSSPWVFLGPGHSGESWGNCRMQRFWEAAQSQDIDCTTHVHKLGHKKNMSLGNLLSSSLLMLLKVASAAWVLLQPSKGRFFLNVQTHLTWGEL